MIISIGHVSKDKFQMLRKESFSLGYNCISIRTESLQNCFQMGNDKKVQMSMGVRDISSKMLMMTLTWLFFLNLFFPSIISKSFLVVTSLKVSSILWAYTLGVSTT